VLHEPAAHALPRRARPHGQQRDERAQEEAVLHDDEAEGRMAAPRGARDPDLALARHAPEVAAERRRLVAEAGPRFDLDDPGRLGAGERGRGADDVHVSVLS
jgi:hypothetical protein